MIEHSINFIRKFIKYFFGFIGLILLVTTILIWLDPQPNPVKYKDLVVEKCGYVYQQVTGFQTTDLKKEKAQEKYIGKLFGWKVIVHNIKEEGNNYVVFAKCKENTSIFYDLKFTIPKNRKGMKDYLSLFDKGSSMNIGFRLTGVEGNTMIGHAELD